MDRYTISDATAAFNHLAEATGHKIAESYKDVGAWSLDYNPTYGGCVIHQVVNEQGGVSCPLGMQRKSPREFCAAVNFALDVLRLPKVETANLKAA